MKKKYAWLTIVAKKPHESVVIYIRLEIDKRLHIYKAKTWRFSTLEISSTLACGLAQQRKKYNRAAFYTQSAKTNKKVFKKLLLSRIDVK